MTTAAEWQAGVGRNWAVTWRQTDRAFAGITEHLLELVGNLPGREVLDIGCGAGELSLALARQRAGAAITGIDISPDLIAAARERGAHGLVDFAIADATQYQPGKAPDLLVSRHGVMFFDDPVGAFAHLRSIATTGARMAFSCFRDASENTWATEPAAAAGAPVAVPKGYAPGPFGFADPEFIRRVLTEAGWAGVRVEPLDTVFVMGQGATAVDQALAFMQRIGPSARIIAELAPPAQDEARERLRALAARHCSDGLVAFPAAVWLVTARN